MSLVAIGILPLLLLTMFIFNSISDDSIAQMKSEMLKQGNIISTKLSLEQYFDYTSRSSFLEDIQTVMTYRFLILNNVGEVEYDSNHFEEGKTYSSKEVLQMLQGTKEQIVTEVDEVITIYVPIVDSYGEEIIGVTMLIGSTTALSATLDRILSMISLLLLALTLGVLILNVYFSSMLTKPFRQFLKHIKRVSEGHIDERITIKGNYEIEEIGDAFNEMLVTVEEIDSSRQQFVANVSHELKTPLSSMKVLAEALLTQEDAPLEFYKEFMEDISSEVDRETQIINDLLTLVTLDKKDNKLNITYLSVNRLIEQVMRMLKPVAEKQDIVLEIKSFRDVNAYVDETKLYLVLMNLIENGIKYNEPFGKVTVTINADHRDMIIKVIDTGIGIPQDSVHRVFDRFYRVDKTRSRDTGGTGLGLNIVHKTVLMHGGNIKCSSKEGVGTTFIVRLPLSQPLIS